MAGPENIAFSDLAGWPDHDHKAAFAAFCHSAQYLLKCKPSTRDGSARAEELLELSRLALSLGEDISPCEAKTFFEKHFQPVSLPGPGLLTGYYEPVFEGRLQPDEIFRFPLHKRPADLVSINAQQAEAAGFTSETSFARKGDKGYAFHYSRAEVMDGALEGQNLELVWLRDPFEAYIIHIQGSAKIDLGEGRLLPIVFDGKSGQPYKSLGKLLIEQGIFSIETITMDGLIDHLRSLGDDGARMLEQNPSYIYFRIAEEDEGMIGAFGPKAAAGVPLIPMRSIAVDRHLHTFGLPFWLQTSLPDATGEAKPFRQMVFAHDTGSAIKGGARGDLFVGTGAEAGACAGRLQQDTHFICLMPKPVVEQREEE
ncbi:MltA domain-containing protein [uncultured Cohaesibacter sp.]|uniref:murein transglycosylase A n=1 Tax=uncultured Cohaesibacter sp. TaxID=1002546 RepID=UPI0029C9B02D|nr:MltA domain-containing protein [uncultured Cohaesibacter sp.]